jgi:hypothetical protein
MPGTIYLPPQKKGGAAKAPLNCLPQLHVSPGRGATQKTDRRASAEVPQRLRTGVSLTAGMDTPRTPRTLAITARASDSPARPGIWIV